MAMNQIVDLAVPDRSNARTSNDYYQGSNAAVYKGYKLYTAFQPIYSFSHRRKVGIEALVRGIDSNQKSIAPWKLFGLINSTDMPELEQILTQVHLRNFTSMDMQNCWLFLNVSPASLADINTYAGFLWEILDKAGIPAHRVVIEVLETAFNSELQLEHSIRTLKDLGCMIAIDDFGAGHSNFERVWRMEPDIVKFDRTMIQKAALDTSVQVMMKGIVEILHAKKCIVLAEGIETHKEAVAAMDANVDLGQGFLLAKPFHISDPVSRLEDIWSDIYNSYETFTRRSKLGYIDEIKNYIKDFRKLLLELETNQNLRIVSGDLFALPRTMRLYVLSKDGSQLSANI
jgi:EAL domain-containing protein (putative c-di-GMP-specific phosphodiesterase class I)